MNISTLIQGFSSYLESLNKLSEKEYNTNSSSISIFMYSSEFKSYIEDELNISDTSIFSKSINEILSMDVVNGKLVENDEEGSDIFVSEEDNLNEQKEFELQGDSIQTDKDILTNSTDQAITISDDITSDTNENNDILSGLLNNIFQDSTVISSLDSDNSGELDKEEIASFLNTINSIDGDNSNLSLNDILGGIEQIKENTDIEDEQISEVGDIDQAQDVQGISGTSSANRYNSDSNGNSGGNTTSTTPGSSTQEKTLDNMTKEELNSELTTAQSDLKEKNEILSSLLDGSDQKLKSMKDNAENLYDIYIQELKNVDEEMAEQVDTLKQDIDLKQQEIDTKDQEIANQEGVVSESENTYQNAISTRENLESCLSTLESADRSDMDSDKQSELDTKIAELKSKITDAKEAESNAKTNLDNAKDELERLNSDKETLEGNLEKLNDQMSDLEAQIVEQYPQIQEYMNAYNEAQDNYNQYKESAISSAKSEIKTSQDYVNEINTAINNLDNKENSKEYSISTLPVTDEELAEYGFDTEAKREAWSHLVPEMQEAIVKLTDYAHSIGIEITYNSKISIFRTFEEQQEIYNTSRAGYAAKPGNSRHESGEAVDITIPNADKNDPNDPSYRALAEYWMDMGYTWGGTWNACEPWHFDLRSNS